MSKGNMACAAHPRLSKGRDSNKSMEGEHTQYKPIYHMKVYNSVLLNCCLFVSPHVSDVCLFSVDLSGK